MTPRIRIAICFLAFTTILSALACLGWQRWHRSKVVVMSLAMPTEATMISTEPWSRIGTGGVTGTSFGVMESRSWDQLAKEGCQVAYLRPLQDIHNPADSKRLFRNSYWRGDGPVWNEKPSWIPVANILVTERTGSDEKCYVKKDCANLLSEVPREPSQPNPPVDVPVADIPRETYTPVASEKEGVTPKEIPTLPQEFAAGSTLPLPLPTSPLPTIPLSGPEPIGTLPVTLPPYQPFCGILPCIVAPAPRVVPEPRWLVALGLIFVAWRKS